MDCGVDIIEIDRIKKSIDNQGERFLNKIYTPKEIEFCNLKGIQAYASFAVRFAAKEAVAKLLKTGFNGAIHWNEIEIENNELGAPQVNLYGETKKLAEEKGLTEIKISLSHSREYAIAMVLA